MAWLLRKFTSEDYENAKNEEKTCDSRIMCISNAESYELKNIRVCVWGDYWREQVRWQAQWSWWTKVSMWSASRKAVSKDLHCWHVRRDWGLWAGEGGDASVAMCSKSNGKLNLRGWRLLLWWCWYCEDFDGMMVTVGWYYTRRPRIVKWLIVDVK